MVVRSTVEMIGNAVEHQKVINVTIFQKRCEITIYMSFLFEDYLVHWQPQIIVFKDAEFFDKFTLFRILGYFQVLLLYIYNNYIQSRWEFHNIIWQLWHQTTLFYSLAWCTLRKYLLGFHNVSNNCYFSTKFKRHA